MEPIYRQVKCIDRLPKESGFYQTNFGPRLFLVGYGRWMGCEPQFWFEVIELPSEEEINAVAEEHAFSNSVRFGANFILNKLKGETK